MKSVLILLIQSMLLLTPMSAFALDINKANATEIVSEMKGIGPIKAKAIVDYRKKNGKFKSTDDLLKVPGMGPETIKKNIKAFGIKVGSANLSKAKGQAKSAVKGKTKKIKASTKATKKSIDKKAAKIKKSKKLDSAAIKKKSKN